MEQMRSLRLSLEGEADCRRVTIAHLSTPSELRRPQASPTTAAEQDSIPVMPKIYVANLDIPGNSIFFFFLLLLWKVNLFRLQGTKRITYLG